MNRPIDVIIPIYNAYEDLTRCVESVRKYTDLSVHRLILINDCSSDARISPFLKSQEGPGVLVIENEKNKGFSGNVNLGMQCSEDRDVLLLNSDTLVTERWLDKMEACAYSSSEIGTVTPMSNAATLCSVPEMCVDNQVPEQVSVDEFAKLIERCSLREYPRITVAVGFCMYIKRQVIHEVGLFDAETFERGYGEENDFCNRAGQLGFVHVMCDDTFIYHKGTVSFLSEEKQKLIAEHEKILLDRYPGQMKNNSRYCSKNPHQYLRDNIKFYLKLKNGRKNILYLIHSDFREDAPDHVGGTQFHLKDLAGGVKEEYNVFVLARVKDQLQLTVYQDDRLETLRFEIGEKPLHPVYRSQRHYEIYRNILNAFEIQLVHIQHLHGLTFDLAYAAKELGIPVYMTLHDFYYICTNEKLLDERFHYDEAVLDTHDCSSCLGKHQDVYDAGKYQEKWEKNCRELLGLCDRLITPSESAREIYARYYPEIADRIQVISHGTEIGQPSWALREADIIKTDQIIFCWEWVFTEEHPDIVRGWAFLPEVDSSRVEIYLEVKDRHGKTGYYKTTKEKRSDVVTAYGRELYAECGFRGSFIRNEFANGTLKLRPVLKYDGRLYTGGKAYKYKNKSEPIRRDNLNVAFVGGLAPAKGSRLAYELIKGNPTDINWFIFGTVGDEKLEQLVQENLYKTGGYEREELPGLFEKYNIDLVCILSVWPETFCYTISESLLYGIPVMVSNLGAMGERIAASGCGFLTDVQAGTDKIREELLELAKDRSRLEPVRKRIQAYREKTVGEMCREYMRLYEVEAVEVQAGAYDAAMLYEARIKE